MTDISQIMSKSSFTVKDLKDECKKRGIKGYSKLNKQQLIDKIMSCVEVETDDIGPKKETNIINDDAQEKKSTLHFNIDFKYSGLSIREIKIIPVFLKNSNYEKIKNALNEEINSNDKYQVGDIITTIDWIRRSDLDEPREEYCYGIICKENSDKKIIDLSNGMITEKFIKEHSYLKNINFDEVMITINKKDCLEPFHSPLIVLSELYSKLNNKPEINDKLQEFIDEGRPDVVLSTLEVLEVDY